MKKTDAEWADNQNRMSQGSTSSIRRIAAALITLGCALSAARASETDQYTLPPQPLVDTGAELERSVDRRLAQVVERTNAEFSDLIRRAADADTDDRRDRLLSQAADLLTPDRLAAEVFDVLGRDDGKQVLADLLACKPSPGTLTHYRPGLERSIYAGTPFNTPLKIVPMLPTLRAHGVYFGGDKLGHLFQQGHEYYTAYRAALRKGASPAQATAKAVDVGVKQEKGLYGEWVDGIYSNADLAANYAGLQFYLNLTQPIIINGVQRPPLLLLRNQRWSLNPAIPPQPLRPFITDHLDESLNPCRYGWTLRTAVRKNIAARAPAWAASRDLHRQDARAARSLQTWFGADYGHTSSGALYPLPDAWFDR